MDKKQSNFRLSETARQILKELAARLGISETAVIELAIRHMAQSEYPLTDEGKEIK